MISLDDFFRQLDSFRHGSLLAGATTPWQPLATLENSIRDIFASGPGERPLPAGLRLIGDQAKGQVGLYVEDWLELAEPVLAHGIIIGEGAKLEPTAIIKSPAIIGQGTEVRQGAYLRGNVIVGESSVMGHATEVKNSIIMDHSHAGHFNYIGDSILGSHVNLGAGSRLANLQFRTASQIQKGELEPVTVEIGGERVSTGLGKLGAIVGDYVEVGCNAVLCPGALVGRESWIHPNLTVRRGHYPPGTILSAPRRG